MRIALGLSYAGHGFHGWQSQPGGQTVQDVLETALARIAGHPVRSHCAGRTDARVHACIQVVHFDTPSVRPLHAWVRGVNDQLPSSVVVNWAVEVDPSFHARFCAEARQYRYILRNHPQRSALFAERCGWWADSLELAAMRDAAARLCGTHDFSAFRAAQCQAKSPVKHLYLADIQQCGAYVVFDFRANAFLHHMIRNLVGALIYVGSARQSAAWIDTLLQQGDRSQSAPTFSPDGLYLCGVQYDTRWGLPHNGKLLLLPDFPGELP